MHIAISKTLRIYKTKVGKAPFSDWLNKLKDRAARARIRRRLDRIEQDNYGDYKPLGGGLYELRFTFGPGYRIYFTEIEETIVTLPNAPYYFC